VPAGAKKLMSVIRELRLENVVLGCPMTRFTTRFAALLFFLSFVPEPLDALPLQLGELISYAFRLLWQPIVAPLAALTSFPLAPPEMSGSGDSIGDWVRQGLVIFISLIGAGAWSFETKRTNDATVRDVTRGYLRLTLLSAMVLYGALKVFAHQMAPLDDDLLSASFSEATPAGLMWRFMGYSPAYQRFAGMLELVAGILLLSRRTSSAGALLAFAAMTNVVALDLCFDVPVKLVALRLWFATLFLLAPEARTLIRFLLLRETATLPDLAPRFFLGPRAHWLRRLGPSFIAAMGLISTLSMPSLDETVVETRMKGVFFAVAQHESTQWERLVMDGSSLEATTLDGTQVSGTYATDEAKQSMHFTSGTTPPVLSEVHWQSQGETLRLVGMLGDKPLDVVLRETKPMQGRLMTWGFHWVQDKPSFR